MWYVVTFMGSFLAGAAFDRRFGASAAAKFVEVETAVRNLELSVSARLKAVEEAVGIKK